MGNTIYVAVYQNGKLIDRTYAGIDSKKRGLTRREFCKFCRKYGVPSPAGLIGFKTVVKDSIYEIKIEQ